MKEGSSVFSEESGVRGQESGVRSQNPGARRTWTTSFVIVLVVVLVLEWVLRGGVENVNRW
jgi:hypothetical protein